MSRYDPLRWGILGTGGIASAFAADLKYLADQAVVAVGSRTESAAAVFADKHGIPRRYGSYAALVADPEVDVVYVATPHPLHYPNTIMALEAGKPVLVEKPFAMDASQAAGMIDLARAKKLFLLEAMWTRFLPHVAGLRRVLAAGTLGEILTVEADHGQRVPVDPKNRWYAPELGGGALLDLGIYPVSFAAMVLGKPAAISAIGDKTGTGVDAQTSILLRYAAGAHAVLNTNIGAVSPNRAVVVGSEARVEIDRIFYAPSSYTVIAGDGRILERFDKAYQGHGLREEAVETARCLRAKERESPLLPLSETLFIMEILDEVRRQIGLVYEESR
jgi:predicted dehydrogenase